MSSSASRLPLFFLNPQTNHFSPHFIIYNSSSGKFSLLEDGTNQSVSRELLRIHDLQQLNDNDLSNITTDTPPNEPIYKMRAISLQQQGGTTDSASVEENLYIALSAESHDSLREWISSHSDTTNVISSQQQQEPDLENESNIILLEEKSKLKLKQEQLQLREEELLGKERRMEQKLQKLQERDRSLVAATNSSQQEYEKKLQNLNEEWTQKFQKEQKKRDMKQKVVEKFNSQRIDSLREKLKLALEEKEKFQKMYHFLQERSATRLSEISITNLTNLEDKISHLEEKLRQKEEQHKLQISMMRSSWTSLKKTMKSSHTGTDASASQFDNQLEKVEKKIDNTSKSRSRYWSVQSTQTDDASPIITEKFVQTESFAYSDEEEERLSDSLLSKQKTQLEEETKRYEEKIAEFQRQATTILEGKKQLEQERQQLNQRLAELESSRRTMDEELSNREALIVTKEKEAEERLQESRADLEEALNTLSQREDDHVQNCEQLEKKKQEFERYRDEQMRRIQLHMQEGEKFKAQHKQQFQQFEHEYAKKMERISAREQSLIHQKEQLIQKRSQVDELISQFGSLDEQRREISHREEQLRASTEKIEEEKHQLSTERQHFEQQAISQCASSILQNVLQKNNEQLNGYLTESMELLHEKQIDVTERESNLESTLNAIRQEAAEKVKKAQQRAKKEIQKARAMKRHMAEQMAILQSQHGGLMLQSFTRESDAQSLDSSTKTITDGPRRPHRKRPNNTHSLNDRIEWAQTALSMRDRMLDRSIEQDKLSATDGSIPPPPPPPVTRSRKHRDKPPSDVYVSPNSLTYYSPHYVINNYTGKVQSNTTPPRQPKKTHSLKEAPHDFLGSLRFSFKQRRSEKEDDARTHDRPATPDLDEEVKPSNDSFTQNSVETDMSSQSKPFVPPLELQELSNIEPDDSHNVSRDSAAPIMSFEQKRNPFPLPREYQPPTDRYDILFSEPDDSSNFPQLVTANFSTKSFPEDGKHKSRRKPGGSSEHPLYASQRGSQKTKKGKSRHHNTRNHQNAKVHGKSMSFLEYQLLKMGHELQSIHEEWEVSL